MSLEAALFEALKPLVGSRVYPLVFPQAAGNGPASGIRYTLVSVDPAVSLGGDSGDAGATSRVQLDLVTAGYMATRALRAQVLERMKAFSPPAVLAGSFDEYDADTKTWRSSIDFLIYASTPAPARPSRPTATERPS